MKIDRLIGIIAALQQHGRVTAPWLAEKFEVSRRTIARDIETICRAGFPVVTSQGAGGGISLMEGCALDAAVLTRDQLTAIFAGLTGLDSVSAASNSAALAKKLGLDVPAEPEQLAIDLSSFYKADLTAKIAALRQAISQKRVVTFTYYYARGEIAKAVEPCRIIFRWSDWYLQGFCRDRQDFRMYKLRRLWRLSVTDEYFAPRPLPDDRREPDGGITDDYFVTAIYAPSEKFRLVEEYGPDSFTQLPDGRLYTRWGFTDIDRAFSWLIGFGSRVEVLDPPELVEKMRAETEKMCAIYAEHDITLS